MKKVERFVVVSHIGFVVLLMMKHLDLTADLWLKSRGVNEPSRSRAARCLTRQELGSCSFVF